MSAVQTMRWRVQADPIRKHWHHTHAFRHITTDRTWDYIDYTDEKYGFEPNGVGEGGDGEIICDLRDAFDIEAKANLLAAAPELFGALRDWLANYDRQLWADGATIAKARAAIAKAEGRA